MLGIFLEKKYSSTNPSLQMTEKLLSFLVRVWFTEAVDSLRLRYKLSAQGSGEEGSSVYTVSQVAKHQFQGFVFSGTGTRGH